MAEYCHIVSDTDDIMYAFPTCMYVYIIHQQTKASEDHVNICFQSIFSLGFHLISQFMLKNIFSDNGIRKLHE